MTLLSLQMQSPLSDHLTGCGRFSPLQVAIPCLAALLSLWAQTCGVLYEQRRSLALCLTISVLEGREKKQFHNHLEDFRLFVPLIVYVQKKLFRCCARTESTKVRLLLIRDFCRSTSTHSAPYLLRLLH